MEFVKRGDGRKGCDICSQLAVAVVRNPNNEWDQGRAVCESHRDELKALAKEYGHGFSQRALKNK